MNVFCQVFTSLLLSSRRCRALLALSATCLATAAPAYQADDVIVRFGPAVVAPDADSDSALGDVVDVEDSIGAGISATYMVSDLVGLELLGALPFEHDIDGKGALNGVDIGRTRQLPPTLLVHLAPDLSDAFQPYVGAGINYTTFFDEDTDSGLDAALGGSTDMSLSDSVGLALEAGVDVPIKDNLMLNLSVWNIDINTTARVKVDGNTAAKIDVEIDPWVYMVGLGVTF